MKKGRCACPFTLQMSLAVAAVLALVDGAAFAKDGPSSSPGTPSGHADVSKQIDLMKDAYIYGFPMIANYKTMYQFNIDRSSGQFKAPFNKIWNDSHVSTPKDTAIVSPNSDTPYSFVQMDLRAEPVVLCVPEVQKPRYYAVQLIDMYTFNFGYIGGRTTGDGARCYMVAGPGWRGNKPDGIAQVFPSETQFALAIYRTQLFNPGDIDNVKKVQAGYKVQTLSGFLGKAAPPAPPMPNFPPFTRAALTTSVFKYLNFLLQFCPTVPQEKALRARFATIGVAAGKPYDSEGKLTMLLMAQAAFDKIKAESKQLGKDVNGWKITNAFGDRKFINGNWLMRAAAALTGIYGNDQVEALYPVAWGDEHGEAFDGAGHKYTITFAAGGLPPVKAFWSVTMYDGKTLLLVANPINRYLINSPMLPNIKTNADGSLTIYIQKDRPASGESNWLPAPDGPFYMVMRLYWPQQAALDGDWKPPPVKRVQ